MSLGNKILALRKTMGLSQEQLAEQLSVTRQTISKWELDETTPDLKQAKQLSKTFKISLDELTDNDIKSILVQKVSKTEKLTNIAIKAIKFFGFAFSILFIIDLITFVIFVVLK